MFEILVAPRTMLATATCLLVLIASSDSLSVISRSEWGAKPSAKPLVNLQVNPPTHVVIHHSATSSCTQQNDCIKQVKNIQTGHMNEKGYRDIAYNFLIGEDGNVYEGQGWGKWGAHATIVNPKSIGICLIGTFTNKAPNQAALDALQELISYGKSNNKIASNYKLIAHRTVKATECPGTKLVDIIKRWPQYSTTL